MQEKRARQRCTHFNSCRGCIPIHIPQSPSCLVTLFTGQPKRPQESCFCTGLPRNHGECLSPFTRNPGQLLDAVLGAALRVILCMLLQCCAKHCCAMPALHTQHSTADIYQGICWHGTPQPVTAAPVWLHPSVKVMQKGALSLQTAQIVHIHPPKRGVGLA